MNLTSIAYYARGTIKYTIAFVIFLIVAKFLWNIGSGLYLQVFPPAPAPPEIKWGTLPLLQFPDKSGLPKFNFTLQTATGELPKLSPTLPVYFVPKQQISFLKLEEAQNLSRSLGFEGEGEPLSETIYRFSKKDSSLTLDINTVNKTLSVNYRLSDSPELLTLKPRSQEEAANYVRSFLSSGQLYADDLREGSTVFEYLKVEGDTLVGASSLSEANFIRVSLTRAPINDIPLVTPYKNHSNVWFLVTGDTSSSKKIIAGEYHYFPISLEQSSTYPIKNAKQAWDELVSGNSYIANYPANSTNITIRKIYLAYFDSPNPQGFLQPIIVFEGDENFSAYVPAVAIVENPKNQ